MEPINGVSAGYHHLADFMLRGLVWTILTTNFDPCLPRALQAKQPHMKRVAEVNRGRDDFAEFSVFERGQVVWSTAAPSNIRIVISGMVLHTSATPWSRVCAHLSMIHL